MSEKCAFVACQLGTAADTSSDFSNTEVIVFLGHKVKVG